MNNSFVINPAAGTQEDGTGISSVWFSSTELSYVNQGEVTLHRAMEILQQQNGWQMETKQVKC